MAQVCRSIALFFQNRNSNIVWKNQLVWILFFLSDSYCENTELEGCSVVLQRNQHSAVIVAAEDDIPPDTFIADITGVFRSMRSVQVTHPSMRYIHAFHKLFSSCCS